MPALPALTLSFLYFFFTVINIAPILHSMFSLKYHGAVTSRAPADCVVAEGAVLHLPQFPSVRLSELRSSDIC